MLAEEADVKLHLVVPLLECQWTCFGPPPLHPFPPGVQEVEGVVQGEVGGLYPELWPDLWRTLRAAVMVQLLHRQLVTTSFGDAPALLAVPERTSSLSPHQRLLFWELSCRAWFREQPLIFWRVSARKGPINSISGLQPTGRDRHLVSGGRSLCWDVAFSPLEMIWDSIPTKILQWAFFLGW